MDRTDLEKNKFNLEDWKVKLKTINDLQGLDDIWNRDITDLEKSKFENGAIRTVTAL